MLKKIIAASALALAASGASAADYGRYLCTYGCTYSPLSSIDDIFAPTAAPTLPYRLSTCAILFTCT